MITAQAVQDTIERVDVNYVGGTSTVVCCLVLTNGHVVVGQAHCAPGTDFNPSIGSDCARKDAEAKVAELLAFEARGPLFRRSH